MSLVIGLATKDFIIAASEKICIDDNGNKKSDNFNKLVKVNSNVIIGCTGRVSDNNYIFDGLISNVENRGFVPSNNYNERNKSYAQICYDVDVKFNSLSEISKKENIKCNIFSMICGYNNGVPLIHILSNNLLTDFQGIADLSISDQIGYCSFVGGNNRHDLFLKQLLHERNPKNIGEYRSILKKVFDVGITFDNKINNNVVFKEIWRE